MSSPWSAAAPVLPESRTPFEQGGTPISPRVLLVDDDEMLSRFLERLLRQEGYTVETAPDGARALDAVRSELDLLVLDLNMPRLDGVGVLEQLRPRFPRLPILVLTGEKRPDSAAQVLDCGADDYLVKPFSCIELTARMRALLRRNAPAVSPRSLCGDLAIDREQMRVTREGRRIDLTPREYGLIEYLMRTPRLPVSRAQLLQQIWGSSAPSASNIVDVYMKYVRDKIDLPGQTKLIRTVRGLGYVVSED